jgi:hypothetical protein
MAGANMDTAPASKAAVSYNGYLIARAVHAVFYGADRYTGMTVVTLFSINFYQGRHCLYQSDNGSSIAAAAFKTLEANLFKTIRAVIT